MAGLGSDIKDENIVLDSSYHAKLIDFGSAAFVPQNGRLFDRFAGTVQYCPPEILQGHKYLGPPQEVWSLGILLYTLMFAEPPFTDPTTTVQRDPLIPPVSARTAHHATTGTPAQLPAATFGYHETAVDLLKWMLAKRPEDRPTIDRVVTHPWMALSL